MRPDDAEITISWIIIVGLGLIIMKLLGLISASWAVVTSPFWIPLGVAGIAAILVIALLTLAILSNFLWDMILRPIGQVLRNLWKG